MYPKFCQKKLKKTAIEKCGKQPRKVLQKELCEIQEKSYKVLYNVNGELWEFFSTLSAFASSW